MACNNTGAAGAMGPAGPQGIPGRDGKDGVNGTNGVDGRGIASVVLQGDGSLVITYNDGSTATISSFMSTVVANIPDATDTVKGKISINTGTQTSDATNATEALTADGFNKLASSATGTPNAVQQAIVNAVEQALGSDVGAQQVIADAIADEVAGSLGFKDCSGVAIAKGESLATCKNLTDAIDAAVAGGSAPVGSAGGDLSGSYPNPTVTKSSNQVLTTPTINGAVGLDAAAQKAIADAIADDLAAASGFAASVKAAETKTTLVQSGTGYDYTNEAGVVTHIAAATLMSTAAGQSLSVKPDGGLYVNVIGILPSDSTYSGSTLGNVDISIVGDGASPQNFTIQGDLNVASTTPTASTNMLKWSAAGFYVSAEEMASAIAANSTATTALMPAIVDALIANPTKLQALANALATVIPGVFEV